MELTKKRLITYNYLLEHSKNGTVPFVITYLALSIKTNCSPAHMFRMIDSLRDDKFISTRRVGRRGKTEFTINIINN